MQALIDFIIRNVMAFWPFFVVDFNQRAVRIRNGNPIEEVSAGLHFRRLFIEKIHTWYIAEDFIDLPFGDAQTKDGKTVTFSANVGFRIVSPMKMMRAVIDVDENLARLALGQLSTLISKRTFDELAKGNEGMRTWLKQQIDRETSEWGIEVTCVYLTNLSCARQIRLLKDGDVHAA